MEKQRRRSDRCGRDLLRSPGRPPVAGREDCRHFWAQIALGRSSEEAAVDSGVSPPVGARWFRKSGGMPPSHLARSSKPLSRRYLSFAEREELAILRVQGHGVRSIASLLKRAPSTISRELRRNAATRSGGLDYRATTAQWHADRSAHRPKPAKLAVHAALRQYVEERLAGMIVASNGMTVSGPAVAWKGRQSGPRQHRRWGTAYVQGRGALRRELTACLRTGRALRMPRARSRGKGKAFIDSEIMISQRPAEVADRAVPGHWEGDLILGLGSSAIGTLVERTTRFTILLHLPRMAGHGHSPRIKNGPVCTAVTKQATGASAMC